MGEYTQPPGSCNVSSACPTWPPVLCNAASISGPLHPNAAEPVAAAGGGCGVRGVAATAGMREEDARLRTRAIRSPSVRGGGVRGTTGGSLGRSSVAAIIFGGHGRNQNVTLPKFGGFPVLCVVHRAT